MEEIWNSFKGVLVFNKYAVVSWKVCKQVVVNEWVKEKVGYEAAFQMAITKAQVIKTGITRKFQITLFKHYNTLVNYLYKLGYVKFCCSNNL